MKKTRWYPGSIKPVHIGLYEVKRKYCDETDMKPHMLRWTGERWEYAYRFGIASNGDFASVVRGEFWRGLRSPA